jgi:type I restriction-modification system DNA methylase subunit
MGDERSAFDVFEGHETPVQAKLYWMKKRSRQYVAGGVHLTENWEDRDFTRNSKYKIGIDFFVNASADSLLVVLSNRGNLRLVEVAKKLTNTQVEIFAKWADVRDESSHERLHTVLWDSFKLQSVNNSFYQGIADSFTELLQHLNRSGRDEEHSKLFSSRLLGRIMFVWFLRSMEIVSPNQSYFEINGDSTSYYKDRLERLFFETLNTPIGNRSVDGSNGVFGADLETPYLNGGLFEPHPGDWYGDSTLTFPDGFFERLYGHFDNYNFTTDESTPEYEQVAIDPEMLGRVFESLLATQLEESGAQARKAKGAFYTPREIVAYMSREALRSYLRRKFAGDASALKAIDSLIDTEDREWAISSSNSLRDKVGTHKDALISALAEVTSIDPACGSGAFPMGMLSALLRLRERLEPGRDRRQLKLSILQNCIFGVDIEPMAVEISRLRAWLAIIVESETHDAVEPLPNLDFRFVCANTLLPLVERGADIGLFDSDDVEDELALIRSQYFSATDMKLKHDLRAKYSKTVEAAPNSVDGLRARQLKSYNPFEYERAAEFFDPKSMFGSSETFDIVIGNPPYISALAAKKSMNAKLRDRYKELYTSAAGAYDMYILFLEKGLRLAGENGTLVFITPTKFLSAKYSEAFREYAWQSLAMIADFANQKVFDSAGVSTLVSLFQKDPDRTTVLVEKYMGAISQGPLKHGFEVSTLTEFPENLWGHLKWGDYQLLSRVYSKSDLMQDVATVVSSTTAAEADEYAKHVSDVETPSAFRKVNTGNISPILPLWGIKPYSNKKNKILEPFLSFDAPNDRRRQMYGEPKAIVSKLSKRLTAMYDKNGVYASSNTVFVMSPQEPYSVATLTAILNSNFMQYVYATMFSGLNLLGSFQFQAPQVKLLPVPKSPSPERLQAIEGLVDKVLEQGFGHHANEGLFRKLNQEIFSLYGLVSSEIETIESALNVGQEDDDESGLLDSIESADL